MIRVLDDMEYTVSKSRLKAHTLQCFRQVEQTGHELVITDRGKLVLKIVPYQADPSETLCILKGSVLAV